VRLALVMLIASHFGSGLAAAQPGADLGVDKYTFFDRVATGSSLTYSIDIFNHGFDEAENVVLTDVLPAGVTFESVEVFYPEGASCTFDEPSRTLTCQLGTFAAFDGASLGLYVQTPSFAGTIVNTATVASSTPDPYADNNSSTVSTEVVEFNLSDLAVTMTASANTVLVHRAVTFTSTVTNLGPQDAAGVQLSLSPPFLADIISVKASQGTCTTTADNIDCLLGPLTTGAVATVTLVVKPQKDGFALTFASVSGYGDPAFFDPEMNNDFAYLSVDVNYPGKADPAFSTTTSQVVPYSMYLYNPCAGEVVHLSGMLRQVVSLTFSNTHYRTNTFTNFQGITGTGLSSGTAYRATGGSRTGTGLNLVFNGVYPREVTILDNVRLVGDGGNTLLLHQNTHFTINANGSYTAVVDNPRLECK
jgi:uncharacterized repeat protein (TIGR01451 family)